MCPTSRDDDTTALLVVDVQNRAVELGPYRGDVVLENIRALVVACRAAGVEVIYVQHDEPIGTEGEPGSTGWEIHPSVRPRPGERIFRKEHNSAFRGTDLHPYLEERAVGTLIIVGIQTEYCVDTTVRVAFEKGYEVIIPEWTNTTYDNGEVSAAQIYELHNRRIFDGRFGTLVDVRDVLEQLGNGASRS